MNQLDIFDNSRDVMLRNHVISALQRDDEAAAGRSQLALVGEYPDDPSITPLQAMLGALNEKPACRLQITVPQRPHATAYSPGSSPLQLNSSDNARLRYGSPGAGKRWRASRPLPFQPEHSDCHAAPCWLRAGDWTCAIEAVGRIESWRRMPAPLAWMSEAT